MRDQEQGAKHGASLRRWIIRMADGLWGWFVAGKKKFWGGSREEGSLLTLRLLRCVAVSVAFCSRSS